MSRHWDLFGGDDDLNVVEFPSDKPLQQAYSKPKEPFGLQYQSKGREFAIPDAACYLLQLPRMDDQLDGSSVAHKKLEAVFEIIKISIWYIRINCVHPSPGVCLGLLRASSAFPDVFRSLDITSLLVDILRTNTHLTTISKKPSQKAFDLAAGCLANAWKDRPRWPIAFFEVYLDDALGSRSWVEHASCRAFTWNVLTALPGASPIDMVPADPDYSRSIPFPESREDIQCSQGIHLRPRYRNADTRYRIEGILRTSLAEAAKQATIINPKIPFQKVRKTWFLSMSFRDMRTQALNLVADMINRETLEAQKLVREILRFLPIPTAYPSQSHLEPLKYSSSTHQEEANIWIKLLNIRVSNTIQARTYIKLLARWLTSKPESLDPQPDEEQRVGILESKQNLLRVGIKMLVESVVLNADDRLNQGSEKLRAFCAIRSPFPYGFTANCVGSILQGLIFTKMDEYNLKESLPQLLLELKQEKALLEESWTSEFIKALLGNHGSSDAGDGNTRIFMLDIALGMADDFRKRSRRTTTSTNRAGIQIQLLHWLNNSDALQNSNIGHVRSMVAKIMDLRLEFRILTCQDSRQLKSMIENSSPANKDLVEGMLRVRSLSLDEQWVLSALELMLLQTLVSGGLQTHENDMDKALFDEILVWARNPRTEMPGLVYFVALLLAVVSPDRFAKYIWRKEPVPTAMIVMFIVGKFDMESIQLARNLVIPNRDGMVKQEDGTYVRARNPSALQDDDLSENSSCDESHRLACLTTPILKHLELVDETLQLSARLSEMKSPPILGDIIEAYRKTGDADASWMNKLVATQPRLVKRLDPYLLISMLSSADVPTHLIMAPIREIYEADPRRILEPLLETFFGKEATAALAEKEKGLRVLRWLFRSGALDTREAAVQDHEWLGSELRRQIRSKEDAMFWSNWLLSLLQHEVDSDCIHICALALFEVLRWLSESSSGDSEQAIWGNLYRFAQTYGRRHMHLRWFSSSGILERSADILDRALRSSNERSDHCPVSLIKGEEKYWCNADLLYFVLAVLGVSPPRIQAQVEGYSVFRTLFTRRKCPPGTSVSPFQYITPRIANLYDDCEDLQAQFLELLLVCNNRAVVELIVIHTHPDDLKKLIPDLRHKHSVETSFVRLMNFSDQIPEPGRANYWKDLNTAVDRWARSGLVIAQRILASMGKRIYSRSSASDDGVMSSCEERKRRTCGLRHLPLPSSAMQVSGELQHAVVGQERRADPVATYMDLRSREQVCDSDLEETRSIAMLASYWNHRNIASGRELRATLGRLEALSKEQLAYEARQYLPMLLAIWKHGAQMLHQVSDRLLRKLLGALQILGQRNKEAEVLAFQIAPLLGKSTRSSTTVNEDSWSVERALEEVRKGGDWFAKFQELPDSRKFLFFDMLGPGFQESSLMLGVGETAQLRPHFCDLVFRGLPGHQAKSIELGLLSNDDSLFFTFFYGLGKRVWQSLVHRISATRALGVLSRFGGSLDVEASQILDLVSRESRDAPQAHQELLSHRVRLVAAVMKAQRTQPGLLRVEECGTPAFREALKNVLVVDAALPSSLYDHREVLETQTVLPQIHSDSFLKWKAFVTLASEQILKQLRDIKSGSATRCHFWCSVIRRLAADARTAHLAYLLPTLSSFANNFCATRKHCNSVCLGIVHQMLVDVLHILSPRAHSLLDHGLFGILEYFITQHHDLLQARREEMEIRKDTRGSARKYRGLYAVYANFGNLLIYHLFENNTPNRFAQWLRTEKIQDGLRLLSETIGPRAPHFTYVLYALANSNCTPESVFSREQIHQFLHWNDSLDPEIKALWSDEDIRNFMKGAIAETPYSFEYLQMLERYALLRRHALDDLMEVIVGMLDSVDSRARNAAYSLLITAARMSPWHFDELVQSYIRLLDPESVSDSRDCSAMRKAILESFTIFPIANRASRMRILQLLFEGTLSTNLFRDRKSKLSAQTTFTPAGRVYAIALNRILREFLSAM